MNYNEFRSLCYQLAVDQIHNIRDSKIETFEIKAVDFETKVVRIRSLVNADKVVDTTVAELIKQVEEHKITLTNPSTLGGCAELV